MIEAAARSADLESQMPADKGHRRWIRVCHWLVVAGFLTLAVSGVFILMVHPRLYWGEVGNDLLPALLELPISNNHQPAGWERTVTFADLPGSPVSASRSYWIFNENGWARSLHFMAAWLMVSAGLAYLLFGLLTGHARRNLLPRAREISISALLQDFKEHLYAPTGSTGAGPPYGLIQRLAYAGVVFLALPLMVLTGMTMSPAVTASWPMLLDLFGGYQSARTIHFFGFTVLFLFLVVHVVMVVKTGFRLQLRAMIWGG